MLKRLFILCLTIMAFVFVGCEEYVNPKKVEFDVAIECQSGPSYSVAYYKYVCYGSLGGFVGDATIVVDDSKSYDVEVTGAKTPYSFTFGAGNYNYKPSSFNVKVLAGNKKVMETVVIPR